MIERQPRERAVACRLCRRETWNVDAVCESCGTRPSALVEIVRERIARRDRRAS